MGTALPKQTFWANLLLLLLVGLLFHSASHASSNDRDFAIVAIPRIIKVLHHRLIGYFINFMTKETFFIGLSSVALIAIVIFGFTRNQPTGPEKNSEVTSDNLKLQVQNLGITDGISPTPTKLSATPKARKQMQKPTMQIDQNKKYTATLRTSEGDIVIALNPVQTPVTVNNFVVLAKNNFYDNTIFHRSIKGFMIQGGDPNGNGTGGPGYTFEDETFKGEYTRGTVAMANAGPNTNGSQFFIMHADYALPPNYVIFGKVIKGLETVDKIATAPVQSSFSGEQSSPVSPVTVNTIVVAEE